MDNYDKTTEELFKEYDKQVRSKINKDLRKRKKLHELLSYFNLKLDPNDPNTNESFR